MTKELLKGLIELVPDDEIDTLSKVVVKFVPEVEPLPDELEVLEKARNARLSGEEYVSHETINWG